MKKKLLFLFTVFVISAYLGVKYFWKIPQNVPLFSPTKIWPVQSIDTVKYSRDLAREKSKDTQFDKEIKKQVSDIAATGATHIALSTPYNDEFVPYLRRWLKEARENNLNVWFRGNVAGWEGWFDYSKVSREEHTSQIISFINKYPDLFEDGDIFTSCPECENGGPGDPRMTGDVNGFRRFLINENNKSIEAFKQINKNVTSGYYSMNGDVARLVMDEDTTRALGGIVTIDHYVSTPDKLILYADEMASRSKGKIVLGEWGAPIPDINGEMNEDEQAAWLLEALNKVALDQNIVGINYWTNKGGSTALWAPTGEPKKAVSALTYYYNPREISGVVLNEVGNAVYGVSVKTQKSTAITDYAGRFRVEILPTDQFIEIEAEGYLSQKVTITDISNYSVTLVKQYENWLFKLGKSLYKKFS